MTTAAKTIMSAPCMELCKWMTISPELKEKCRRVQWIVLHSQKQKVQTVLGSVWRPVTDDFVFNLRGLLDILKETENTKQSVLQSARIFAPLG